MRNHGQKTSITNHLTRKVIKIYRKKNQQYGTDRGRKKFCGLWTEEGGQGYPLIPILFSSKTLENDWGSKDRKNKSDH